MFPQQLNYVPQPFTFFIKSLKRRKKEIFAHSSAFSSRDTGCVKNTFEKTSIMVWKMANMHYILCSRSQSTTRRTSRESVWSSLLPARTSWSVAWTTFAHWRSSVERKSASPPKYKDIYILKDIYLPDRLHVFRGQGTIAQATISKGYW